MRRLIGCALAAAVLAGCGGQQGSRCGDSVCKANEVCDQATKLCLANLGPKLAIDAPADGAIIGAATFELRGSAQDDEGKVLGLEYALGDGPWTPLELGESGTFGVTIDTPVVDGPLMPLKVRAHDGLDQETVAAVTVQPDRVAPNCAITAPVQDAWIAIKDGPAFQLSADATDGSGAVQGAEFSTDDGATWVPATVNEGKATASWTLPAEDAVLHTFKFRAKDAAGNPCGATLTASVDTHAPVLSNLSPANGERQGADTEAHVDVDDASPQLTVVAQIGNATPATLLNNNPNYPNVWATPLILCPAGDDFVSEPITVTATDAAGNQTVVTDSVIVDDVGPAIAISSPAQGDVLNLAATPNSTGTLTYSIVDGNPQFGRANLQLVRPLADGGIIDAGYYDLDGGSSAAFAVLPNDNGTSYQATLTAKDALGNSSSATRNFLVDRVPPTFNVNPQNGSRNVQPNFTVTFSEPVTIPDAGGFVSWTAGSPPGALTGFTGTTLSWAGLGAGRSYSGIVGTNGTDLAGNPIVQQNLALFTEVATPADNAIVDANPDGGSSTIGFVATSDQDGVVSFAVRRQVSSGSWTIRLAYLEPTAGQTTDFMPAHSVTIAPGSPPNILPGLFNNSLNTWAAVRPDLSADRVVGSSEYSSYQGSASWGSWVGSSSVTPVYLANALQIVPSPSVNPQAPRTGPLDYGALTGTTSFVYSRPPNADVNLNLMPAAFAGAAEGHWNVADVQTSSLKVRSYNCDFSIFTGQQCTLSSIATIATDVDSNRTTVFNPPSVAATPGGKSLYVYESTTSGTRGEACAVSFFTSICQLGVDCPVGGNQSGASSEKLHVASAYSGTLVFGTRLVAGKYELVTRDLEPCTGSWNVVASASLSVKPNTDVFPVRFGSKLGALYVDTSGNVRVWKP